MLFDPERHGPEDVAEALRPAALARLREIVSECAVLQTEAAEIMRDEARRLSESDEEFEAARLALAALFHVMSVEVLEGAAEEFARPVM